MGKTENCPKSCRHLTFHYCEDAGTHCDNHCICSCSPCVSDRESPGPVDPQLGGKVLSGAIVQEVNGEIILHDPEAAAIMKAVAKHNCSVTLKEQADRVKHFKSRLAERGMTPAEAVVVLVNVDDPNGGPLADLLMPGNNWQVFRDKGEIPFARGLAMRDAIQEFLESIDEEAATKLQKMTEVAVVVVDNGVAEVFAA